VSRRIKDDEVSGVSCFCIRSHHPVREHLYDFISHWLGLPEIAQDPNDVEHTLTLVSCLS